MLSLAASRIAPWVGRLLLLVLLAMGGCATLPENVDRVESHAYRDIGDTRMAESIREESAAHPGESGFLLLGDGLDAFVARAVLASRAERSIDAQYYLLHGDLTGKLFIDQLVQAADRGVRVRLLVDDIDLGGRDEGAAALDAHPNIEVRLFNPFSRNTWRMTQYLTRLGSVTRRMHNKSFTADNIATIVGGRNIGDEYFNAHADLAFADLDVLAVGPVVAEVSESFDLYWNNELAYPASILAQELPDEAKIEALRRELEAFVEANRDSPYLEALRGSTLAEDLRNRSVQFVWAGADVFYDQPEKITESTDREDLHLSRQLGPHLGGVQEELIIFSAYFVPGKDGTRALSDLAKRGVRVRILTNALSSTDVAVVHAGYAKYRKRLLRAGVELYEMNKKLTKAQRKALKGENPSSKASLHTKSFVLDRESTFIGSFNLDPRSMRENTEIGLLIDSPEIAAGMGEWFDTNIDELAFRLELVTEADGRERILWHGRVDGEEQVFDVDPYTSIWRRMGVGLAGFLPIESQL
ncbi:MAG: phospholipase D family protein [Pseudomonadota bacterium]|nr:phospholipase D family protein [Pseudomonadota bacterium]